jgi:hypothetical protein
MSKNKPYNEEKDEFGVIRRTFYETTDSDEFVWHRDHEDRVVIPLAENNWMLQFDNELPIKLNVNEEYFIPKNTFHRVIKGSGDLMVEIIETTFEPDEYEILGEGKKKSGGKKDACYYKVKSRYKVWPSAYASGALVKCRKVGAKNWGNKTKEGVDGVVKDELSEVSDNMYDLIRNKYPNKRVIMSHEPEIEFRNTPISDQSIKSKPKGLWYGFGTSWLDWIKSEMPHWERDYMHIIEINPDKILTINSREELDLFTKKYGAKLSDYYNLIDWSKVAKDYSGIEIPTYISSARREVDWYYPWDVESGCIWNSDGVKSIKLIGENPLNENKQKFQDIALDKINKVGGFDKLPDIDKLALLGGTNDSRLMSLDLNKIFKENGGTFGKLEITVRVKDENQQPIKHKFSKEFAGKKGYLYPYINYSEKGEPYVTVRFDEFISDPDYKGGGSYEERPIFLANMYPIDYDEIKSDFVKYQNKVDQDRSDFLSQFGLDNMDEEFDFDESELEVYEAKKTDFSKEKDKGLHGWFERQGGKGKSKGWVDCNTCRTNKKTGRKECKPCGRKEGEKRKYPACRPTPSACGTKGKGKNWGKKSSKTNENRVHLIKNMLNENSEMLDVVEVFSIYNSDSVHTVEPDVKPAEVPTKPVEKPKTDSPYAPSIKPKTKPKAIK